MLLVKMKEKNINPDFIGGNANPLFACMSYKEYMAEE